MKRIRKEVEDSRQSTDEITRIVEALMDKDIDPDLKARMQQWFLSDLDDVKRKDAFIRYSDKIIPYVGKLKGEELKRYNKLAAKLGLKPASEEKLKYRSNHSMWLKAAAVMIPVFIAAGTYILLNQRPDFKEMNIAKADYIQSMFLPDSSSVSVNPGSSVHYRESAETREVKLSGDAFFKVTRDTVRPFTVSTVNMNVNVLGTDFRVSEFPDASFGMVSLFKGSVEVETDERITMLSRGERLKYDIASHNIEVLIIPASEMISNGYKPRLKFNGATFGEILDALSAFYEVDIVLAPGVNPATGNLTVDFDNESLENSLDLIMKMSKKKVAYTIENDKVTIYKE